MRSLWFHDLHGQFGRTRAGRRGARSPTDLVLIEGYKREVHPKFEVRVGQALSLVAGDPNIAAIPWDQ